MDKPNITCYLKPMCGWSEGVRSVLRKHGLEWDEKDVMNNPEHRTEMIERSGQMMQPCVEINGNMLADVSGDEVEAWMLSNDVVAPTDSEADAPTDQPCADEIPKGQTIQFKN
ncbi:MAG: glutaredoxin [Gammaproteobacteria bacterium]|nr:glutaredoxin [Gammaproteobacteria bacterium]